MSQNPASGEQTVTKSGLNKHMKSHLLVTAVGEDRPGIVARLAEAFVNHAANMEESRMAVLGGEFAVIVLVTVDEQNTQRLIAELESLKSQGLAVSVKPTKPVSKQRFDGYTSCSVSVSGADHEGIVHRISMFLRDKEINIEAVETSIVNAPETGYPLFCMSATVQVPPSISVDELQKDLNAIAREECVDVFVKPVSDRRVNVGLG